MRHVDSNRRTFNQEFQLFIVAMGLDSKLEPIKVALLITIPGPQAMDVYNMFVYADDEESVKLKRVLSQFYAH